MVSSALQYFRTRNALLGDCWNRKKYKVFKDIVDRSVKEGGTQIEYEDEDPKIKRDFEAELAQRGIGSRMG